MITDEWARLALAFARRAALGTREEPDWREADLVSAFLICLANELICKAILRLHNPEQYDDDELKRLGHDIPKLLGEIKKSGVELPDFILAEQVKSVFDSYRKNFFKYPNLFHILGAFDNLVLDDVANGTLELLNIYDTLAAELSNRGSQ